MKKLIHQCKIHCHSIDPGQLDLMGVDDVGKWMPFAFHLDIVVAIKLSTDEEDLLPYNCTTVFTENGDTYIIDTPYTEFEQIFLEHHQDDEPFVKREASL